MSDSGDTERVVYFALMDPERERKEPGGIARRRYLKEGYSVDETFRRDLTWQRSSVIYGWERGDLTTELVEISEEDAERITEGWKKKWSEEDAGSG